MLRTFVLLLVPVLFLVAPVHAQTPAVSGSATFSLYCATCHGPSAKGNGPMAAMLNKPPADLTRIAKRNGGTFSSELIAKIIDGRSTVKGHGGGDMPVWGDAFAKSADTTPPAEKIARLVAYLESIQVRD
jgi:hypothetical protein